MPLEIRELVIRVEVQENAHAPSAEASYNLEALKSKLIEECVRKIVDRIENHSNR